tara:strand:+ start:928 stop:1104 length:177 start_codon:yes stop_codon:yes gene_type:complete
MKAELTTKELNDFSAKIDILESKGYDLSFTIDKIANGNYNVEIHGEHDLDELDKLTES